MCERSQPITSHRERNDSRRIVCKPYLGTTSRLPVTRAGAEWSTPDESDATELTVTIHGHRDIRREKTAGTHTGPWPVGCHCRRHWVHDRAGGFFSRQRYVPRSGFDVEGSGRLDRRWSHRALRNSCAMPNWELPCPRRAVTAFYLGRGIGPLWGFLYGWTFSVIMRPGAAAAAAAGLLRFIGQADQHSPRHHLYAGRGYAAQRFRSE
jgi:hypothetical protein